MLLIRQLVESTAVNAVCVLPLENGLSVLLASISESVHVYDMCPTEASSPGTSSSTSSTSAGTAGTSSAEFRPRGHVFHVGCGVVSLLALANQCVLLWTRDQECILVRYQANLTSALLDPRVVDTDHVYRPSGQPSPVHYKEHHWYVAYRVRLWCPDACAPVHPPEMGVNDSMEVAYLRFCSGHIFLISFKWDSSCQPGNGGFTQGGGGAGVTTATARSSGLTAPQVPSLRTTRWHTCDYMRMYAGTRFHYPTQSCSVATRRPGESAGAHQSRIEQLWQSGSAFANVPDEDLIATHAVMELSKRKAAAAAPATPPGAPEKADWTGVRVVSVRRETYASTAPLMPSPALYCGTPEGDFVNVRTAAGQAAVQHGPFDAHGMRYTPLKDDYAKERVGSFAVVAPRRAGRRGLDWTLLAFVTSTSHTAVYHLQRARTPLRAPHYVLDGLFAGPLRVRQVLFCTHSGDASKDVWVVLSDGAVARFSVAELRARSPDALRVEHVHQYPWPVTPIVGLPRTFLCRRLLPADNLFTPGRGVETLISNINKGALGGGIGGSGSGNMGVKSGLFSVYPCARRYAVLSDCVQDVYVVDLVERRVVASLAGDGPMTDVCEAPHGYVTAFARGVLRYFQPGMQLHVRGTARLPPLGVPIHSVRATRVLPNSAGSTTTPSRGIQAGVYVMFSTHHNSQLYHIEDANMRAFTTAAWAYVKDETTLAFEWATSATGAGGGGVLPYKGSSFPTPMFVQCTPSCCIFGSTVHRLPSSVFCAVVAMVPGVGPVCVAAFSEGPLACTHLAVVTATAGACVVDVTALSGESLGLPACIAARGLANTAGAASMEVVVGRWDGCVTVLVLELTVMDESASPAVAATLATWRCVASQTLRVPWGKASPVHEFLPLPRAGRMSRWMAAHSSGDVSILALGRRTTPALQQQQQPSSQAADADTVDNDTTAARHEKEGEWAFVWVPTSPPHRKAQQVACALVPLVRAPPPPDDRGNHSMGECEDEAEVLNGFDGALLQPRDGALLLFSVPLEEGDTQAPPHMRRLRESDEKDQEWVVQLENTVRAIVGQDTKSTTTTTAGQERRALWQCAVLLETVTPTDSLRYDALIVQHDEVILCTLDEHLFTKPYPRERASSVQMSSPVLAPPTPPQRARLLACMAPSRYICTQCLKLPQLSPHETLVSIAHEPDDEGEGVLLCVTVCEPTSSTRLTTLHSGTLTVMDSLVLHGSLAQWMSAVPPSTPSIARTAPLFLLCSENMKDGSVQLQVVAAHPLRITSSEALEDSSGWVDVASHGVKVDGAVQVVPTRINRGDTYGGEVLVTVTVECAIHLFVLRGYTLLFQHCVLAPACVTSVTLCYPIVSVCTEGDSNVYLQVYPVNDEAEVLAPSYSAGASRALKQHGMVSWKMRVSMREPTFGATILAQVPLYDRCVRTDVEGGVTVMFVAFAAANSKTHAAAAHVKGEDLYVGSAEGPQTFLTHAVRLPAIPLRARVLRHVASVQRRTARQLRCSGHSYHLQSSSVRKDRSSRLLLLPCHDGSLYGGFEIPYGFAHPLLRLEQVITDTYALDMSLHFNPSAPGVLQHTYHLQPFHVARALQPLVGTRQAEKQACVMVDAVLEYLVLRDMVRHGGCATACTGAGRATANAQESDAAVLQRKYTALDDVIQTLLTEEYGEDFTADMCAEMLNAL
jgi:hypothetical protein